MQLFGLKVIRAIPNVNAVFESFLSRERPCITAEFHISTDKSSKKQLIINVAVTELGHGYENPCPMWTFRGLLMPIRGYEQLPHGIVSGEFSCKEPFGYCDITALRNERRALLR